MEETKRCSKCGIEQSKDNFYKTNANKDGLCGSCISCKRSYAIRHPTGTKEYHRLKQCEWHVENPDSSANASRLRRSKRKQLGLCTSCSEPKLSHSCYCRRHWILVLIRKFHHPDPDKFLEELWAKLVSQNFRCPYTNELLVPGINASIDHIMPKSRFPELLGDIENLEWVSRIVNTSKSTMTREEFMKFGAKISQRKI